MKRERYILQRKNDKPKNESASSLTLDLNSGLPTLDMLGNRRITIEGSTGVLRYESEKYKELTQTKWLFPYAAEDLR